MIKQGFHENKEDTCYIKQRGMQRIQKEPTNFEESSIVWVAYLRAALGDQKEPQRSESFVDLAGYLHYLNSKAI